MRRHIMPIIAIHQAPKEVVDVVNKIILAVIVVLVLRYVYHLLNQTFFLYRLKKLQKKYYSARKMLNNGEIDDYKFNKILDGVADGFMRCESKGREFPDKFSSAIENIASDIKRRHMKPKKNTALKSCVFKLRK